MMEFILMPKGWEPEPDPPGTEGWREEPDDCAHEWESIWSTNFAGRAYRCVHCWERTD